MDSDSDPEVEVVASSIDLDLLISEVEAKMNYEEAGEMMHEEEDPISINQNPEIMNSQVSPVLQRVLQKLSLPYEQSDFQKLALHSLLQKKDVILLSPTGSGKVTYN